MRSTLILSMTLALSFAGFANATGSANETETAWSGYLDFAYVYVSAEPQALRARLEEYAAEAGVSLSDFAAENLDGDGFLPRTLGEDDQRRRAVAHLLLFIASGNGDEIEAAVASVRELENRLERSENRWWFHYILAHHALHHGNAAEFSAQIFDIWRNVVAELEVSYATYEDLALRESSSAGFMSALPFLYENLARIILIRSQEAGIDRGLDALGAIVRMLDDGRVGEHPKEVPIEASAAEYLDHIVRRLTGPESDGESLTFTLALFEANRKHEKARNLLASEDLSESTREAIRISTGAYRDALHRANTIQGRCAVYTRALRQLGELHAAKQRMNSIAEIEVPFSIQQAMALYEQMEEGLEGGWKNHGYRNMGRAAYVSAMHRLWEEIQEASFNVAEFYLSQGSRPGVGGNEAVSDASAHFGRYLNFFEQHARPGDHEGVPTSAYFAAYVAARGVGDAALSYRAGNPSTKQIEHASQQYRSALEIFPFDRGLWARVAHSFEQQGRERDFLSETQSVADRVERSRHLNTWIEQNRELGSSFGAIRRALSDDLAIMYLGFAQPDGVALLEEELTGLVSQRDSLQLEVETLAWEREELDMARAEGLAVPAQEEELPVVSANPGTTEISSNRILELAKRIEQLQTRQDKLTQQIELRSRALPLFQKALDSASATRELAARRDHPAHTLLRQLYFENLALREEQS
ncbi:MAG: hypothetical protein GY725_01125 [bacterium]|nr:hypothetical protein [bacterium]